MTSVSARNNPRGFEVANGLDGELNDATGWYRVSANNANALFPGDLVSLNSTGGVEGWVTSDASALSAADPVLGVVKALYDTNGKPLTFSQPTKGPFLDASTAGFAEVYHSPDAVFVANASASIAGTHLLAFAPVNFGTNNSAAGISGQGVDLGNTVASSVGNTPLRVIGIAEFDSFPNNISQGGATHNDVLVQIADHAFRRQFARVGSDS